MKLSTEHKITSWNLTTPHKWWYTWFKCQGFWREHLKLCIILGESYVWWNSGDSVASNERH